MPQLIEAPRRSVSGRHGRADRTAAGVAPDSRRQRSAGHANAAGRARPTWEMPCSCAGLRVPRNPSLPSSEAEPGGQGRPDRAERSEPRSGALDGRAERSYPGRRRLSGRRVHLRSSTESQISRLADQLDQAKASITNCKKYDLEVLELDPYGLDTPANHRDAQWFTELFEHALKQSARASLHLRGVHYVAVAMGWVKPNGQKYRNDDDDWKWLNGPSQAARWLEYIDLDAIVDERNDEPLIRLDERARAMVTLGDLDIRVPANLTPRLFIADEQRLQPYRLAFFGEKTSLRSVLEPLADDYHADLLLPTGEASIPMCHRLAKVAADDGRKLIVFYLSDSDIYGYQMCTSVARKLQALKTKDYPGLEFELYQVALTPEQVKNLGLPHEPYKLNPKTGKPPDKALDWKRKFGVGEDQLDEMRTEARAKIRELHKEVQALNDAMRIDIGDYLDVDDLPELPEGVGKEGVASTPVISTDDEWPEQTFGLIARKEYRQMYRCLNCGTPRPGSVGGKKWHVHAQCCSRECARAYLDANR